MKRLRATERVRASVRVSTLWECDDTGCGCGRCRGRRVWFAVIGVVFVLTAKPLARYGEASGAVLLGEMGQPLPRVADPLLVGLLRLMGLFTVALGLLS
jgi:hypothetical protein